jgi:hypothetical protein
MLPGRRRQFGELGAREGVVETFPELPHGRAARDGFGRKKPQAVDRTWGDAGADEQHGYFVGE